MQLNKPSDRSVDAAQQAFRQAVLIELNIPSDRQCWYSSTCLQTGSVDAAQHSFRQAVLIQLNIPSDRQC